MAKKPHRIPIVVTSQFVRAKAPKVVEQLYELFAGKSEVVTGYKELAALFGISAPAMQGLSADLTRSGVVTRRYEGHAVNGKATGGKTSYWTLSYNDAGTALTVLDAWYKDNPIKTRVESSPAKVATIKAESVVEPAEPIALRKSNGEVVEAIAGPDMVSPFEVLRDERKDESAAFIEAARQYKDRFNSVKSKLVELEKLGITVDWANIDKVVHLELDARLEAIALVLPYVDQLTRMVDRLTARNVDLASRVKTVNALTNENNKLREQVNRLIAKSVGSAPVEAYR